MTTNGKYIWAPEGLVDDDNANGYTLVRVQSILVPIHADFITHDWIMTAQLARVLKRFGSTLRKNHKQGSYIYGHSWFIMPDKYFGYDRIDDDNYDPDTYPVIYDSQCYPVVGFKEPLDAVMFGLTVSEIIADIDTIQRR